jgi:hypothetical protein
VPVERREDCCVLASLMMTVALVRFTTETDFLAAESVWFARLTGSSAGCEARVRIDLAAGLLAVEAAICRGACWLG